MLDLCLDNYNRGKGLPPCFFMALEIQLFKQKASSTGRLYIAYTHTILRLTIIQKSRALDMCSEPFAISVDLLCYSI